MIATRTCCAVSFVCLACLLYAGEHQVPTEAKVKEPELHQTARKSVRLEIAVPPLELERSVGGADTVRAPGFTATSRSGWPELPYRIIEVELPNNADPTSVSLKIREAETRQINGRFRLRPAPYPLLDPRYLVPEETPPVRKNETSNIYQTDAYYPPENLTIMNVTRSRGADPNRGWRVRVLFSPVRYNPVVGSLTAVEGIEAELVYEELDPPFAGVLGGLATSAGDESLGLQSFDYVIVTTNSIRDGSEKMEDFVQSKIDKGFSVYLATEDDWNVPSSVYPDGRAERIRTWLRAHYEHWGIQYVLLIGNGDPDDPMFSSDVAGDIPMKQVWHRLPAEVVNGSLNQGLHWGDATDWYYADLTGNWDIDGDGFFGERPWLRNEDVHQSPYHAGENPFSVRWTGSFDISEDSTVEYCLKQWQGTRVWVDDQILFDHWSMSPTRESRTVERFTTAGPHDLKIEYRTSTGHGHILFFYELGKNSSVVKPSGLTGEYYANAYLSGASAKTVEGETVEKSWQTTDYAPIGGVDLDAEVAIGRIPVYDNNYEALDRTLYRTIVYESGLLDAAWQKNALIVMNSLDDNTPCYDLGEAISNEIVDPSGFTRTRIYNKDYGLTESPVITPVSHQNVVSASRKGVGIALWMAHGTPRWAGSILDSKYDLPDSTSERTKLEPPHPAFTFQGSCHNGSPYVPECYPECGIDWTKVKGKARNSIAYSLLTQVSISTVAASEVSYYKGGVFNLNRDRLFNQDLVYLYAEQIIANERSAGEALAEIKYTHFGNPNVDSADVYHQQLIYNLYGDPSATLVTPCLVRLPIILKAAGGDLGPLYEIRGRLLEAGSAGRHLVRLYYRHSGELIEIVRKDSEVRGACLKLVRYFADKGSQLASGTTAPTAGEPFLSPEVEAMILALFPMIERHAGRELKQGLKETRTIFSAFRGQPLTVIEGDS